MKPFNYEIATHKVIGIMQKSGLTKKEQRTLLIEMLNDEVGLKNIGEHGREHIADQIVEGNSVMFLDGLNIDIAKVNELADSGRVTISTRDGVPINRLTAHDNNDLTGYATVVQPAEDPLRDVTVFGRSRLSPESAARMVHQHLNVHLPNNTKAFANQELATDIQQGVQEAESARDRALTGTTPELLKSKGFSGVLRSTVGLNVAVAKGKALAKKAERLQGTRPYHQSYTLALDKENPTPGEQFAIDTQQDFRAFVREQSNNGTLDIAKARKLLQGIIQKLAEQYKATPAQVRYVSELYDLELKSVTKDTVDEWVVCSAWASAAEFIPDIHEYMEEFERRIARIYWPPAIESAATFEATLMAVTYSWSTFHAKTFTEWVAGNDGEIIGNLLGVLAGNGHRSIQLFINKVEPIKNIVDLADFGLTWLDSNFAKLEIGHKLAASLCLTDIPDDLEVKAPWPAWSFVIPDGLFVSILRKDGTEESFARALCAGTEVKYLVSSTGRCVGPIQQDQTGAPEAVVSLLKLLGSVVKGACLALSEPDQYKKKSLSKNDGSFKTKRVGGAPELNNARFMLSAAVQVDLRDVVHAVQRGGQRQGGKLTVQFLVRGHWKNQAHGPRMSLRKRIWLQPFWKGNEETRILLRNYVIKDTKEEGKDGPSDV